MSNVGGVTFLPPASNTATTGNTTSALTQQDFLQLMVAQFTQQDPLASGSDSGNGSGASDYVNQLMSMTNLTTMQTMSAQQGVQLAQAMPGSTVTLTDANGNTVTGPVAQTVIDSNGVNVVVNGVEYPSGDITQVNQTVAEVQAAAAQAAATAAAGSSTPPTNTSSTN